MGVKEQREANRRCYAKHIHERRAANKRYREENKEKESLRCKLKYLKYRDKILEKSKIYRLKNIKKYKERSRKYNRENKEKLKIYHRELRLKQYGLTISSYNAMLERQKWLCAICGNPKEKRNFVVDHCHATGRVRGIIHYSCNLALGNAKDNPDILRKAAAYLEGNL